MTRPMIFTIFMPSEVGGETKEYIESFFVEGVSNVD